MTTTTPFYPSLIDEQLAELQPVTVTLGRGQTLLEALGLPPEMRLVDTPICSAMTIRNGCRYLSIQPCARP